MHVFPTLKLPKKIVLTNGIEIISSDLQFSKESVCI